MKDGYQCKWRNQWLESISSYSGGKLERGLVNPNSNCYTIVVEIEKWSAVGANLIVTLNPILWIKTNDQDFAETSSTQVPWSTKGAIGSLQSFLGSLDGASAGRPGCTMWCKSQLGCFVWWPTSHLESPKAQFDWYPAQARIAWTGFRVVCLVHCVHVIWSPLLYGSEVNKAHHYDTTP
jgi:hypothetical protein